MVSQNFKNQIDETQRIRNNLLGNNHFSNDEIKLADNILSKICSDEINDKFIIYPFLNHPYLKLGLAFTHGWYSNRANFKNPESTLPRASKARLVLFREYFMLTQFITDPWMILNQVCSIKSLKDYAQSGCKSMDLNSSQYFLHSSHTIKFLKKEEYDKIDNKNFAAILYPMYEGEVIAAIVSIVATILGVEYAIFRNRVRDKRIERLEEKVDERESIIHKQNEIITQMLLEMRIRELKLFNLIDSDNGTIMPKKLKEIYFDSYFPDIEMLRSTKGNDCPQDLLEEQTAAKKYADEITPQICQGKTLNGDSCKRLVTSGEKFCWQHKDIE